MWTNQEGPVVETIQVECLCGYSQHGNAYCTQQLPGDADYIEYIKIVKEWIASPDIKKCGPERKFEFSCVESYAPEALWESYIYWQYRVDHFNIIYDTDTCGGLVFNEDYEDAKAYMEDHDDLDDGDFGALLVLIGTGLLF